jgi:hypothetical protein
MGDFSAIDAVLMPWAEARGLHVYTGHKQNVVRSMTLFVWLDARHDSIGHVWLDPLNELGLAGLHGSLGSYREDEAVPIESLASALDEVWERLAAQKTRGDAG